MLFYAFKLKIQKLSFKRLGITFSPDDDDGVKTDLNKEKMNPQGFQTSN